MSVDYKLLIHPFLSDLFSADDERQRRSVRDLLTSFDIGPYQVEPQFAKAAIVFINGGGELALLCMRLISRLAVLRPGYFSRKEVRAIVRAIESGWSERSHYGFKALRAICKTRPELFERGTLLRIAATLGECKEMDCREHLGLIGDIVERRPDLVDFGLLYEIMAQNRASRRVELDFQWENYPPEYRLDRVVDLLHRRVEARVQRVLAVLDEQKTQIPSEAFDRLLGDWRAMLHRCMTSDDCVQDLIAWYAAVEEAPARLRVARHLN